MKILGFQRVKQIDFILLLFCTPKYYFQLTIIIPHYISLP